MPAVAFRAALANAALASGRSGPRLATTLIPYGLLLSSGFVMASVYARG